MRVSTLYNPGGPVHGKEVFIIGSGPSLKLFPKDYLEQKTCILLNDVQRYAKTLGPIAFSNNLCFLKGCELPIQIVKGRLKNDSGARYHDNHCRWDHPKLHVFSYLEPRLNSQDQFSHFDDRALFHPNWPDYYWNVKGGSVSIFAMQFALLAGATAIHLVGCDCSKAIAKYMPEKPTRKRTLHDFDAYARGAMRMIYEARQQFDVPVVSCFPWPGYGREGDQYKEMETWT